MKDQFTGLRSSFVAWVFLCLSMFVIPFKKEQKRREYVCDPVRK